MVLVTWRMCWKLYVQLILRRDIVGKSQVGKSQVSKEQVEHMHKNWRGNGGHSSLYNLAKRHGVTVNEAYVILSTPLRVATKRAQMGKRFVACRGD